VACCDDCAKKGGGCADKGQFNGKPFGIRPDLTKGAAALAGTCCAKCQAAGVSNTSPCGGDCGCAPSCCGWADASFGLAPNNATTKEMAASLAGLEEIVEGLGVDTSGQTVQSTSWATLALTLAAGVAVGYYGPKVYAKYTRHHGRRRRMAR